MMRPAFLLLAGALFCTGCSTDLDTPTSPSSTGTTTIKLFTGVIPVKGTKFYSYTVSNAGTVTAMLASLTTGTGTVVGRTLELGIGIPAGTGCAVSEPINTTPALVPQLAQEATAGTYCVRIADLEGLPASMNFAIRIVHP